MSTAAITVRPSDELRIVMQINMRRAGFTSMAAYLKYLVRKDAMDTAPEKLVSLARNIPEEHHMDFDGALLRITEAPQEKRSRLFGLLSEALDAMLHPRTRRDLGIRMDAA